MSSIGRVSIGAAGGALVMVATEAETSSSTKESMLVLELGTSDAESMEECRDCEKLELIDRRKRPMVVFLVLLFRVFF